MAFSTPRTFVVGEVITADMMNTHVRDQLRYLKGLDGTSQVQAGLEVTGSGAYIRPPVLSQAQVGSLTPAAGWLVYNDTKGRHEGYGTAWREIVEPSGTSAQGDVLYASGTGWERLAAGTAGQYLKTQGAAANPMWVNLVPALTGLLSAGANNSTTGFVAVGTTVTVPAEAKNIYVRMVAFFHPTRTPNVSGTSRAIYNGTTLLTLAPSSDWAVSEGTAIIATTGTAGTLYFEHASGTTGAVLYTYGAVCYETIT